MGEVQLFLDYLKLPSNIFGMKDTDFPSPHHEVGMVDSNGTTGFRKVIVEAQAEFRLVLEEG